jgi:hypothetical protein
MPPEIQVFSAKIAWVRRLFSHDHQDLDSGGLIIALTVNALRCFVEIVFAGCHCNQSKELIVDTPAGLPNPQANLKAIQALLTRVRGLNKDAKARLGVMLDDEADLPYLDAMEREYARAFQEIVPEKAVMLRGMFVQSLNQQREKLVGMVRNALHENDADAQADAI